MGGGGALMKNSGILLIALVVSVFFNVFLLMSERLEMSELKGSNLMCQRRVEQLRQQQPGQAQAQAGGEQHCPECPTCPEAAADDHHDGDDAGGGEVAGGVAGKEEGWVFGLERKASKTDNTIYNPAEDAALVERTGAVGKYARSPVPKGSWKVRVSKDKWVTMDEVAFAYDVWYEENQAFQYTSWLGVFVQQDPTDAFAIQDMLWRVKPDLIVEVGTNTGGGAIFYSTIMKAYNPDGKIVTLDVKDVSNWNKRNNERCVGCVLGTAHPWWNDGMINFIKGRVTEKETRDKVQAFVDKAKTVLVIEDASHRYPDTLQNVDAIYQWVTVGSYLLVQDTKMDRFVGQLKKKL